MPRANPSLSGASTPVAAVTRARITLFAVLLALSLTAAMVFAGRASAAFEPAACSELRVEAAGQVLEAGSIAALKTARCGYLTVPENRLRPTGRTISLAVAIVPPVSSTPAPDPVVYLAGGPGVSAISGANAAVAAGFNRDRELILVDQRGVGFSKPPLFCPDSFRFVTRRVGLVYDAAATGRRQTAATRACRRDHVGQGVDLSAYNTTENAADVADLRTALGLAEWNVYGVSYGTDLALTLMREHPEGIRSATLDSVVPPHTASLGGLWDNAREGFDNLFSACAAQRRCRQRHPGLRRTFTDLVRKLEARPVTTRARPTTGGPPVKVVLDGGALANWLVLMALGPPVYPNVPNAIDRLAAGRPDNVAAGWASLSRQPVNGLQNGVFCSEWVPYEPKSDLLRRGRRAFPSYPDSVLAQAPQLPFTFDDCRVWDVPKAPAAQRAVTQSSIPTLLLSGTFDAVTAPSQARVAAQTLPNSTVVDMPGVGHDVVDKSRCGQRVLASFLSAPGAPDTSCVAGARPPVLR